MKSINYTLPLQLGRVIRKEKHPYCSNVGQSLAQNIHLILLTSYGEHRFDRTYGCYVWESDFEILPRMNQWKTEIAKSIEDTIKQHEKRLTGVKVKVEIDQKEFIDPIDQKSKRIKKRITVEITGDLVITKEPFRFSDVIYFSPVSLD